MKKREWTKRLRRVFAIGALGLLSTLGVSGQGLPEPSMIFYGTIRNRLVHNALVTTGDLRWEIRNLANGRTITLTAPLTNYSGFSYILEVPCESIVTGSVSSNALALAAFTTNWFDRSVVLLGSNVLTLAASPQATFSAATASRGKIERVDLLISVPCTDSDGNGICDDWEMRYFGYVGVDPRGDPDGDGLSNLAEFLAGTDPTDPNSALRIVDCLRNAGGGMEIVWNSSEGRTYSLLRTTSLFSLGLTGASDFRPVRTNLLATPPLNSLIDTSALPAKVYFYRVELEP